VERSLVFLELTSAGSEMRFGMLETIREYALGKLSNSGEMKIIALRGLAQFLSEESICLLIQKFNETLVKRPEKTPYNYQEYELLKGKHALPYLIDRYGYKCLKETLKITNKNYDRMPDAFKGHWTTDENGEITWLRSPEESSGMMSDFFEKLRWRK